MKPRCDLCGRVRATDADLARCSSLPELRPPGTTQIPEEEAKRLCWSRGDFACRLAIAARASTRPASVVVVRVGAARVTVRAPLEGGGRKLVVVRPESLRRRTPEPA